MNLDQILNTISIPLEHDGLAFQVRPFTTAQIGTWHEILATPRKDGESDGEWNGRVRDAQVDFLAKHLKACVVDGKATRVTSKWVAESLPNVILGDLADFMVYGKRPTWARDPGDQRRE